MKIHRQTIFPRDLLTTERPVALSLLLSTLGAAAGVVMGWMIVLAMTRHGYWVPNSRVEIRITQANAPQVLPDLETR